VHAHAHEIPEIVVVHIADVTITGPFINVIQLMYHQESILHK
jgi:hypothetical protein